MRNSVVKKWLAGGMALILSFAALWGCKGESASQSVENREVSEETDQSDKTRRVTDAAGNQVEVPESLEKIAVTPLPWSSVVYAIDGTSEHMMSINPGAMTAYTGYFLEKLDPAYGKLDTTAIGKDFSINMEQLVSEGVQACVIWDYQTEEAKQLTEIGITPVMVKNETVKELQDSFRAIGQMLGKEERAQQFIDVYSQAYEEIKSYADQVEQAEKPKVLYLRDSELKLQGNDNFIKEALEIAGADNVAAMFRKLPWKKLSRLIRISFCSAILTLLCLMIFIKTKWKGRTGAR